MTPFDELPARLLPWFRQNDRRLPWRDDPTPYHVWLSEIMLQQTRIEAVIPYYLRFLDHFPTVAHLAAADDEELLKCWEGLGYYSRARNLKKAAALVMTEHGGQLPPDEGALGKLPGIGPYTAGAVASIAYGRRAPAVDGNVLRVVTRLTADERDVSLPRTKADVTAALARCYPPEGDDARAFTQALMEVGQTVCLPNGAPRCDACPLADLCRAKADARQTDFPVKPQKRPRKVVPLTVFLFRCDGKYAIEKRPPEGLLAGLWQFPNLEGHLSPADARAAAEGYGLSPLDVIPLPPAKHIFTHLEWEMTGYLVSCGTASDRFPFASPEEIRAEYALASAFSAFRDLI